MKISRAIQFTEEEVTSIREVVDILKEIHGAMDGDDQIFLALDFYDGEDVEEAYCFLYDLLATIEGERNLLIE